MLNVVQALHVMGDRVGTISSAGQRLGVVAPEDVGERDYVAQGVALHQPRLYLAEQRFRSSGVAKVGLGPLLGQELHGCVRILAWQHQAVLLGQVQQDSPQLIVCKVVEAEGAVKSEAALEPRVLIEEHLLDLRLVAAHDNRYVVSRLVVHLRDERVQRLCAVPTRVLVQGIRLVNHQDLPTSVLDHSRGLLGGFSHRRPDQVTGSLELDAPV
mmetsp:Transcript_106651/g.309231  ORF Transcript_106651/g.309231 Transcript_106651/m.309231 type:complete len:213 (-) Transcript_106651:7328-7966(-)